MSNYTVTTNFGAKDSLPSTDVGKVIKGSEFTTEFTNIQTAIATKADTAGDTFTGAVTFDAAVTLNADVTFDTNTLFIDVSANKVGIGNTSPSYELDVTGSAQLSGGDLILRGDSTDADTQSIRFENASSDDRSAYIRADYDTNSSGNATSLVFGTNPSTDDGSDRMVINSDGKVGIGTDSPDRQLTIANPTDSADMSFISGNAGNALIYFADTDDDNIGAIGYNHEFNFMNFRTNDLERMRITSSGNVGIGTTSPSAKATIEDGDFARLDLNLSNATGTTIADIRGLVEGTEKWRIGKTASASDDFTINVGSTERMRIDSSGNLLVGTTDTSLYNNTSGEGFSVVNNELGIAKSGACAYFNRMGSDGENVKFFKDGSTVGSISVTGSATSYNTSSDERLKENIADSADAGSKIDAIQIRQFDWIADGSHQDYGVIAQELINVAPEAVTEGDTEEDMMGVDYSKLVPMLIKEVQSLRSRVAELENA